MSGAEIARLKNVAANATIRPLIAAFDSQVLHASIKLNTQGLIENAILHVTVLGEQQRAAPECGRAVN